MANACTQGLPSAFSSDWRTKQDTKVSYVEGLLATFGTKVTEMDTAVDGWALQDFTTDPPEFSPPNGWPTFDDFTGLRPPPIDPVLPPRDDPPRPDFIDLDPVPPDNIPVYDVTKYVPDWPPRPPDATPTFTEDPPPLEDVEKPVMPPYTMPQDPVLYYPLIPDVPEFNFIQFDADLDDFIFIEPPTFVNPGELGYSSSVNDAVRAKLLNDIVYGGTGLSPLVEDAIWRRESERALLQHQEAMDQIADEFGRRGFKLPPQMMNGALMVEKVNFVNKSLDTSRDIAIKQAELAQNNTQFSVTQGNAYENMMITLWNNINQRVFEASKAVVGYSIEVYRANIERYNQMINVYKTKADVWKTTIDGEVAKMQGYIAKLEGAKTTIELSKMNVDVYSAKIAAIKTIIDAYAVEMEAAKVSVEIESLKIQRYKAIIDAYVAQVNAVTAKFQLYAAEIDGEKAKISGWMAEIDGYKARVEAAKADIDAHTARINAQSETNKSHAVVYSSDVDAYKALITSDIAKIESEVKVYEGQVKGYEADARAFEAMGSLDMKVIDSSLESWKTFNTLKLENDKLDVASYLDRWKIYFNVYETEAQVYAQVLSAALNSEATSTHFSESYNYGQSSQTSCIDQHYYEETTV